MPELPTPNPYGYDTPTTTLTKLMNSMRNNGKARVRIKGIDGDWVSLRVFVVCIQEKKISNPRWKNNCRLIFTLFIEGDDEPIRILYVTGDDGEEGHGGRGFDHIHLEDDVKNCGMAEREHGWPQFPYIVSDLFYKI